MSDPCGMLKALQRIKVVQMKTLNTADYLTAHRALRLAKYPSLSDTADLSLQVTLTVCIEFEMGFDEIQSRLDNKTYEMVAELSDLCAKV